MSDEIERLVMTMEMVRKWLMILCKEKELASDAWTIGTLKSCIAALGPENPRIKEILERAHDDT